MRMIAVVASKGGVGKTTVSNVLAGLVAASGRSVELWDTDCNQFSAETMSFSDLLQYPVITLENETAFNGRVKESRADFVIVDTAPHAHDTALFAHILRQADAVIGVTRPLPNDVLAFEKIMLPLLGRIEKPKALLVNQRSHIQSSIQQAAEELIRDRIGSELHTLKTPLHSRASYAAIGYFEADEKADKKRNEETASLEKELKEKGIL